jgi:hypothetical protein
VSLERFALASDLGICRILNGMWQVRIEAVLARSRDFLSLIGDCGDEYR